MAAAKTQRPPRLCRTPEEAWQAGWDDGADDPPMTDTQIAKLAVLLRPYLRQPRDPAA